MTEQEELIDNTHKYLTFQLSEQEYGIEINKVQEIIEMLPVKRVPSAPNYIRGIINLNGRVIPVVDLRLKFGLEAREYDSRTSIILVQVSRGDYEMVIGVIVDDVTEVVSIPKNEIEQPFAFSATVDTEFIAGMGKIDKRVLFFLDIDKVLTNDELSQTKALI